MHLYHWRDLWRWGRTDDSAVNSGGGGGGGGGARGGQGATEELEKGLKKLKGFATL